MSESSSATIPTASLSVLVNIEVQARFVWWPTAEMARLAAEYDYLQRYKVAPLVFDPGLPAPPWADPNLPAHPVLVPASTLVRERYVYWTSNRTHWSPE